MISEKRPVTRTAPVRAAPKATGKMTGSGTGVPKGEGRGRAYDRLRERILSLELGPGSPLDEAILGRELGVSRTPMREAFVRLSAEGLVELMPNRGARVTALELRQLQEHLEAFELLQRSATVLATQRRTDADIILLEALCCRFEELHAANNVPGMIDANWAFHHAIGAACGNRYLERMYDTALTDGLRVARLAMAYESYGNPTDYEQHMQNILREHRELVQAIKNRNVETATRLSDSHSDLARLRVSDYLSRNLTRGIDVPGQTSPRVAAHV